MMTWIGWGCFVLLCFGLATWGAGRLLYHPMRYPAGEWHMRETLRAADVALTASDNVKLHAWWIAAPNLSRRLATLHLHGNAGNLTHRGLPALSIVKAGSSVLLLDYRGYGKSQGKPSEAGLYKDAEAAYDWLVSQGYTPGQIVIHGESLGCAVAVYLATKRQCAGVVLEAPFPSARAVAGRVFPVIGPMLIGGYDSKQRIPSLSVPVLIVHGDRDEIIAYDLGQDLFQAAKQPKWFWTIPGAGHNNLHTAGRDEFPTRLASFYRGLE